MSQPPVTFPAREPKHTQCEAKKPPSPLGPCPLLPPGSVPMSLEARDEQAEPRPGGDSSEQHPHPAPQQDPGTQKDLMETPGHGAGGWQQSPTCPKSALGACWHWGGPAATPRTSSITTVPGSPMFPACCEMRGSPAWRKGWRAKKSLWSPLNLSWVWLEMKRDGNPSEQVSGEQEAKGEGGEMGEKSDRMAAIK